MKIAELKDMLQSTLNELEDYDDNNDVKLYTNTYFIHSSYFLATRDGFIDLNNPVDEDEDY